jgi:hypothetical protein
VLDCDLLLTAGAVALQGFDLGRQTSATACSRA